MNRRPLRIFRGAFEPLDVESGGGEAAADLGSVIASHRQKDGFAGEDGDGAAVFSFAARSDPSGTPEDGLQVAGQTEAVDGGIFLGALAGKREFASPLALSLKSLGVVFKQPFVPALRADAANGAEIAFDRAGIRPISFEAFPVVQIHGGEKIGDADVAQRAAAGEHDGEACGALELHGEADGEKVKRVRDARRGRFPRRRALLRPVPKQLHRFRTTPKQVY